MKLGQEKLKFKVDQSQILVFFNDKRNVNFFVIDAFTIKYNFKTKKNYIYFYCYIARAIFHIKNIKNLKNVRLLSYIDSVIKMICLHCIITRHARFKFGYISTVSSGNTYAIRCTKLIRSSHLNKYV